MPTYEYLCEANGRVVEVRHKMAEDVKSWGELCDRAGVSAGDTDPQTPVRKLVSAGFIGTGGSSSREPVCEAPACGTGPCGSGMCGLQ
jgi:hypothetical protein